MVWISATGDTDQVRYAVDSDTTITRGLLTLLLKVLDNQPAEEIINADLFFIDKIGLKSNLSPSRANGLISIIKRMKQLASEMT